MNYALQKLSAEQAQDTIRKQRARILNDSSTTETVREIISRIASEGDAALLDYTTRFDKVTLKAEQLRVPQDLIENSAELVDPALQKALSLARDRIHAFHTHQSEKSWFIPDMKSSMLGQKVQPMDAAGLYSPGGKAMYPSSLIMNAVPAAIAGVPRIVLATPPNAEGGLSPVLLYAAKICGISEIYTVGGAQAVAAMALGTETIAPVDKITGPGNKYVSEAKRQLFGIVDIDMIAGPSEILVYADDTANPDIVAADLFSQAEHDEDARVVLVSPSIKLIDAVNAAIIEKMKHIARKEIIEASLQKNGFCVHTADLEEAFDIINSFAPEHLEIMADVSIPEILAGVRHAGAIFIGSYSPEALGDYMAGTNHILPTYGSARFFSPLGVADFVKRSSIIAFSRDDLKELADDIICIARHEQLPAHADSVSIRFEENA